MPDLLLDSGSSFDRYKALLSQWLKTNLLLVCALTKDTLDLYGHWKFLAGWSINLTHKGKCITFHVLIDARFPYSAIRLAYKSENVYFKWPHVDEKSGILCLPKKLPPISSVESAINLSIIEAIELVDQCQDPEFLINEFKREFLSYWERTENISKDSVPVRSLLNLQNKSTRAIFLWRGEKFTLVGESAEQILSWLNNTGLIEEPIIERGAFSFLNGAPTPPFPKTPAQLFSLLKTCCANIDNVLSSISVKKKVTIILAATSPSGDGLIAIHLSIPRPPKMKGYRKKASPSLPTKKQMWCHHSELTRCAVQRYEPSWVHGRGLDVQHQSLYEANVLLLGCGSLGSQVALRLAQAGVGGLTLIDPELLVTANVGRHALGIDSVGAAKAVKIASVIRAHFPHMRHIEGHRRTWQQYFKENEYPENEINIIVSCLGEWSADGPLGEWHARAKPQCPVIWGWLDEYGTAAHGLVLGASSPHLGCVLGEDGNLRTPETLWSNLREVHAEPACGTLFQPYGSLDVAKAEILVTRLCIDALTNKIQIPCHRIYAGSTSELHSVGGVWSDEHLKHRPKGYEGPFEYERSVLYCGACAECRGQP